MDIPKEGIKLTRGNFSAVGREIQSLLDSGEVLRLQVKAWKDKRSLSQNRLVHLWFNEISDYLISSGRKDATPEWVKTNLKRTFLGCEEVEFTNFKTGERVRSYETRHTSKLDTGEMHFFLNQIEEWCMRFGLSLTIPAYSEYQKLKDKQNE